VRNLRVALVSDTVPPFHKGGKEKRIERLTVALRRRGYEIDIYTMQWWPPDSQYRHNGIAYHALSKLYPLYAGERRSIREGLLFSLACFKLVFRDFDVIEADHMPYFPLFSLKIVALLRRKPLYGTWHEVVGQAGWRQYLGYPAGRAAYLIERLSVRLPNKIVAASDHTAEQLRRVLGYRGSLTVVANGIDYERIRAIAPASATSDICYVGRLVAHKNVDLLIKAVARLAADQPKVRCLIIGGGPEFEHLQALIKRLGVARNVTMTGLLEDSREVYAHLKASRLFVSPSSREGFGITVLEAYACGLPVITIKHPDNAAQYLIRPGAGAICAPTAAALSKTMRRLLREPSKDIAALVNAPALDWQAQLDKLDEVYGNN
jgi:glycosyltransferase involved in cell wall biosynthesis